MISISRSLARRFRAVVRRAGLCKAGPIGNGFVRLVATADAVKLQASNGRVAIEHRSAGQFTPADITVPIQLFADCEAKSDAQVMIRIEDSSRLIAAWDNRGVPQQRDYSVPSTAPEMPPSPEQMTKNAPHLLAALREAKDTADSSSTRYALDCLQLKTTGTIAATDTRQLLVQSGFSFPWTEDQLIRATNVFACSELATGLPVEIGRTEGHVAVRTGEWTIHHEIEKEGRFPKVDTIVPSPDAIQTRMQVDPRDAKFLADMVSRLPADDLSDRPLTLDLNGSVVVRARKDEQSPMTELLLSGSRRVGNELRVLTNRDYLHRALELGFSEIGFVDAEHPCVCQDATRTYLWMVLEPKDALKPSAEALTIDSMTGATNGRRTSGTGIQPVQTEDSSPISTGIVVAPVNRVAKHLPQRVVARTVRTNDAPPPEATLQPTDVIEQALALRNQLRSMVQGLTDLVAHMRQQRKQTRLMKSTLQSLKQLQLLDA